MAGYAAFVSLAQTAEQMLNTYHQYSNISAEEKQQIKSIHDYAIQLQASCQDFPIQGHDLHLAYEAEDMIECLMWNQQMQSISRLLTPPPPTLRHERFEGVKYAHYLSLFNDLKIIPSYRDFCFGVSPCESSPEFPRILSHASLHAPSSHKDVVIAFGNDDLKAIKSHLFGESSSQLQVIPILGIGGIGKTTLARSAYDDPSVKEFFHTRAWVVHYHRDPLLIVEGSNEERSHGVLSSVYERLKGRRYLIVMDDMCSAHVWDDVRNMLPDDSNGSRIMITTRFSNVVSYPDINIRSSPIHEMCLLDEDQSWNLLRHTAFADPNYCPLKLEDIGKEMARGCKGFPLAIVVTAGLLSTISNIPDSWEEIAKTLYSIAKYGLTGGLFTNSTHSPHRFRRCSLFMDGFQKDNDVDVFTLTGLWIATIKNLMLMLNHPQLDIGVQDLERTRKRIESIVEESNASFANKDESSDTASSSSSSSSPSSSSSSKLAPSHNDAMIGSDDDLLKIKHLLCGESAQLRVVPIFGMGGIGKTTLAKNAYDDPLVVESFNIRAWVTITQYYTAQEVLSSLLVSMDGFTADDISKENNDDEKLYKRLKGRRYLIVLDDMWNTNAWDDIKMLFPDDGIGSRIILTTRLLDVASYPDQRSSVHEIQFMDANTSWKLLHEKVFPQEDVPPELIEVGRGISKGCSGLPLAIVVVAGLLSTISKSPACWEEVAENINTAVARKDREFEKILSLSYTHLPYYLRPCFLHLGAFPEDHEIRVSKLIKLWVAEGFLNGSEAEAEECLENLIKRSLVSVKKYKSNGRIKSVSLHDMMRDLCIRIANKEEFLANIRYGNTGPGLPFQRRMSIAFPGPIEHYLRTYGSAIHTIMWFLYTSLPCLESFRLLRVLDAGDGDVESLPARLFSLFHLRYLAVNYPRWIPGGSISQLQNLQTLIIRARGQWKHEANHDDCLPQETWTMLNLRHLLFYGTLPDPEGTTSTLENLQTLAFSLSNHTTEGMLKMTPNLKRLKVNCYDRRGRTYFKEYLRNMACLLLLESLEVRSHNIFDTWEEGDFNFPKMLKKLTLSGLRLSWNEMTAVCSLPNLQVKLKDYACIDSTWETDGGEFPELEYLLIQKSHLEDWITESCHFPKLKFLLIHDCCRLSEIPGDFGEIYSLELIEVKGQAKKSLVESAKRIQDEQKEMGYDDLQVRCITHWANADLQ